MPSIGVFVRWVGGNIISPDKKMSLKHTYISIYTQMCVSFGVWCGVCVCVCVCMCVHIDITLFTVIICIDIFVH